MARTAGMDDLFGHVPQQGELPVGEHVDLFSQPLYRSRFAPVPRDGHTPDTIRAQALDVLAEARAAEEMPWGPELLRSYTAMFPFWAEWLKGGEGDRLLAQFKVEMDRLQAPVEQVAPNWRVLWKLGPFDLPPEVEARVDTAWRAKVVKDDLLEAIGFVRTRGALRGTAFKLEPDVVIVDCDESLSFRTAQLAIDVPYSGDWPSPIRANGAMLRRLAPKLHGPLVELRYHDGRLFLDATEVPAREV